MTRILDPAILPFVVAIVGIVVGGAVSIVRQIIRHRERIAMIDMGNHPDYPPLEAESPEGGAATPSERASSSAPHAAALGLKAHTPAEK